MSKINLKELVGLFAKSSTTEELPEEIRRFAAQLAVLTSYVGRMGAKIGELDSNVGVLAQTLANREPGATAAPATNAPQPPVDAAVDEGDSEEEAAKAMAAKLQEETAAEVAALNANPPPVVTPIRKQNGGQKITVEEKSAS